MEKIKYSNSINMKLKDYFSAFGLRYDLREAKKFLMLDAKTPRPRVIKALKALYNQIEDEHTPKVYSYTLTGGSLSSKLFRGLQPPIRDRSLLRLATLGALALG